MSVLRMDDYLAQSVTRRLRVMGASDETTAIDPAVLASLDEAWGEGEPDLVAELIDLYLGDSPQWVEAMRAAAAADDPAALKRAAHTLKGSSGSLGVRQVAETCGLLELSGRGSAARVEELLQELDREFATALAALAAERIRRVA